MKDFALYGNAPHLLYLQDNAGRQYVPSVESDFRHQGNMYKQAGKSKEQSAGKFEF